MLWIALADDASHAVALHDFAVLTDRLDAAANFHGSSGSKNFQNLSTSRADSDSNEPGGGTQVREAPSDKARERASGHSNARSTAAIAATMSGAPVTARPSTRYRAPARAASPGVETRD